MPLQSAHVFASHIGHSGKTTLSFNMSCFYARRHPEVSVLVMDLAEEGDLTKRLLGGVDAYRKVEHVCGSIFRLLGDAESKATGLTSWLWTSDLDITAHVTKVAEHNANVPPNLFLVSSGAWPRTEDPLSDERRKIICRKIRDSLANSSTTWKLFCDTDGDRRPSAFTMLGYGLCPEAIIPLHLSKGDLDRIETMLGMMNEMRKAGEIDTQVLLIVWNMVKSQKDEPTVHKGFTLPITPTKVSLDILDACNQRICAVASDPAFEGLFVHGGPSVPDADFLKASVAVMKMLADNVLKPSEECGLPFVEMLDQLVASGKKSMTFKSGDIKYDAKDDVITNVADAMEALSSKFEAMSVSR
mmetsp:Transcript_22338/g.64151  ORF Transcript_22338/g.64151 Transcript_22338/m.64151 type:complete len:357 (-) Transcript_22338:137-1207(-)